VQCKHIKYSKTKTYIDTYILTEYVRELLKKFKLSIVFSFYYGIWKRNYIYFELLRGHHNHKCCLRLTDVQHSKNLIFLISLKQKKCLIVSKSIFICVFQTLITFFEVPILKKTKTI